MEEVIERVKQEALLDNDKQCDLADMVNEVHPNLDVKLQQTILVLIQVTAEAQLEKLLKRDDVLIKADDQELPKNPYMKLKLIPLSEGYIGYGEAQQDMLKVQDGKVWVNCLERRG